MTVCNARFSLSIASWNVRFVFPVREQDHNNELQRIVLSKKALVKMMKQRVSLPHVIRVNFQIEKAYFGHIDTYEPRNQIRND